MKRTRTMVVVFTCLVFLFSGFAAEETDGVAELAEAVALAQQSDRPIFLQLSTTWCGWCRKMDKYLTSNEPVKAKLAEKYQYCKIMLNQTSRAGVFINFPSIPAVPHIFILDKNGNLLHSQYTGALEKESSYDEEKFMQLLTDWEDYSVKVEALRQTFKGTLKPVEKPEGAREGLSCEFYAGTWEKLPDFSVLEPQETRVVETVNANKYNAQETVGVRFSGWVHIDKPGQYDIRLSSNDGSRLKLAGVTVIDLDGLHLMEDRYSRIELAKGYYPIEVDYFRNGGNYGLMFSLGSVKDATQPIQYFYVPKK